MNTFRISAVLLILFLSTCLSVKGQYTVEEAYFSINEKYKFNMPTIGISLQEMPAFTGFNADIDDELETFLSLFEEGSASYFFDKDALYSKTINVRFSLPNEDEEAMQMSISAKNSDMTSEEFYDMYTTKFYTQQKLRLETKMGVAHGIRTKYEDETTEIFFIRHEDFYFQFKYSAENSKFCQSIIKSISTVKFKEKDFESYHKHLEGGASNNDIVKRELKNYKGKAEQPIRITIPGLGLKMLLPRGCTYDYSSPDAVTTNNGNEIIQELNITQNDLLGHTILFTNLSYKGVYVMYRIWNDMPSPKEQIKNDSNYQKPLKEFQLAIDGVTFDVASFGHEEIQTINAYAQLNGFGVALTIMSIEKDLLPFVEEILNGLSFDNKHIAGSRSTSSTPLSKLLNVKERQIKPQPKISFREDVISKDKLVRYALVNQGISFSLPKGIEFISPEDSFSKETSGSQTTLKGKLADNEFITIGSVINYDPTSVSVYLRKVENTITLEKVLDDMVKTWSAYNHLKITRSGIGLVNNKKWGVMETDTDGTLMTMFFALHNDIQVMVTSSTKKASDTKMFESLLYLFKFD